MAKIKMGHLISEARGKINGTVFSRNTYGAYIRAKVTPINPSSTAQMLVRTRLTSVSQAWRGLTDNARLLWNSVSVNYSRVNIFGDQEKLTGFNLFLKLNRNRLEINEAVILNAPQPEAVFGFTSLSVVADFTLGTMDVTFAPAIPVGTKVIVYATPPMSAGITFVKSEFRKIAVLGSADVSPENMAAAYIAVFGAMPPVGSKIFIQFKPITISNGQPGTRLQASDIAA